ncbi:MAG: dihydrodipicolinate synthase family protein [Candidatus Latescibacterota bacterium]
MGRITAEELRGIWAGVTMSWDENDAFDEASYRVNTERMCQAGVHGIYTTGSTGEFYALDYEEFCRMVDIQVEICSAYEMPLQIGCCADATRKTLKLLEYAASKSYLGAAQVNIPYWMELNDRELLQFFADLHDACPDMPLVHYNVPRAKRFLQGPDYLRLLEVAPNLIGVKYTYAGAYFSQLQDAMRMTPQLSYFVGENLLASCMALGARGCCSSLVSTNPEFTMALYDHAAHGRWNEAFAMQQVAAKFFGDAEAFIEERGEGTMDPVFDKGLAVAAGCAVGSQRTRAPYIGWSDETIVALGAWLKENYPQFVYPEEG